MVSNKILAISLIIILICIIVYLYYNNPPDSEAYNNINSVKKRVRFDDKIKYRTYTHPTASASINPDIDVDSIMSYDIDSGPDNISDCIKHVINTTSNVKPVNNSKNPDHWYENFDQPLMSESDRKAYVQKIHDSHKGWQKSMSDFIKYQTDDSMIIKTDTTIDPFKSPHVYKGCTVGEIYDKQVAGPKAVQKEIKYITDSQVMYKNESEINGAPIANSKITGFTDSNSYRSANFGDAF